MRLLFALIAVAICGSGARAQENLKTPQASPAASVSQTVGLTEITVDYHRPAVNGRKVWGDLVPFGEVWRAGANENTTIRFSTPVKVGGKPLAAGTYGLHMIPTAKSWTIIFNTLTVGWGSFSYDVKEDALRTTVTPTPTSDFVERLAYTLDEPTDQSVTVALRWEKLRVPFVVEVDTPAVVMASMRAELRGLAQFNGNSWSQAADYWLNHGGKLDEAQKFADRGLKMRESFFALNTRANLADKRGDGKLAATLHEKALRLASEPELNAYGYTLLGQKRVDEAIAVFQKNVQAHPQSGNTYDSLGDGYLAKNDRKSAAEAFTKALGLAKDEPTQKRLRKTLERLQP